MARRPAPLRRTSGWGMILDRYLARRFLRTFVVTLLIFFGFFWLVDLVE